MKDYSNYTAIGRLTKDSEVFNNGNYSGLRFAIAVNGFKEGDVTFPQCSWFTKDPNKMSEYLKKGKQVLISGEPSLEVFNNKPIMKVVVHNVQMLGGSLTSYENPQSQSERMQNTNSFAVKHGKAPVFTSTDINKQKTNEPPTSMSNEYITALESDFNASGIDEDDPMTIPF